ncbi:MAG: MFS transporter [Hyphomicrobiales bacterium]|nr:MFS transporter [Hyphomicrobiales bacterium]MBV8826454.1 MFS transporter [Hyphomicrobiales bacterium]
MIRSRWFMLIVLFLARTAMAVQFQSVGSLGPILAQDLALDYAAIGTLIGLYMLPGVVIALPGGVLMQRFGATTIAFVGLAAMAAGGMLMGTTTSFALLAAGRLVSGTGAVLLNVALTKMTADWFVGREIVTAMSILIASWPFGIALALVGFVPLASAYGWPAVMHAGAAFALASLALIAAAYRNPPGVAATDVPRLELNLTSREWLLVLIAGGAWGIFNVAYISIVSFTPGLYATRGYSLAQASGLVSVLGWSLIVTIPLGGYLAEASRRPYATTAAALVLAAASTAMLATNIAPLVVFAVAALLIGLPAGPLMAMPAQALRAESRAPGMGVFYTCYYAAMALLPGLAGMARDVTGNPAAPVLFAATMMLLTLICVVSFAAVMRGGKVAAALVP